MEIIHNGRAEVTRAMVDHKQNTGRGTGGKQNSDSTLEKGKLSVGLLMPRNK